jgi:hypothetical protein
MLPGTGAEGDGHHDSRPGPQAHVDHADALYGVTSGDDSVSRIVSLRLEEAQAIAGRQREVVAS